MAGKGHGSALTDNVSKALGVCPEWGGNRAAEQSLGSLAFYRELACCCIVRSLEALKRSLEALKRRMSIRGWLQRSRQGDEGAMPLIAAGDGEKWSRHGFESRANHSC